MITRLDVYDRIANQLQAAYPTMYIASERELTPPKLPCAFLVEIDGLPREKYVTLDLSDSQRQSTFELQAYSNDPYGATLQLESIVASAESLFRAIGYRMIFSSPIDNELDTSIKRHICRFTRIIGGDDTLPPLPTPTVDDEEEEETTSDINE